MVPVLATDCMEGAVRSESAERLQPSGAQPSPGRFHGQYHFRTHFDAEVGANLLPELKPGWPSFQKTDPLK